MVIPATVFIGVFRHGPFESTSEPYGTEYIDAENEVAARGELNRTGTDHSLIVDVLTIEQAEAIIRTNLWDIPSGALAVDSVWGYNWVDKRFVFVDCDHACDIEALEETNEIDEIKFFFNFAELALLLFRIRSEIETATDINA